MNSAFSKILISVVLIIFAVGGIFAWQYFGTPGEEAEMPEEEVPTEVVPEKEVKVPEEEAVNLVENLPKVKEWLALFTGPGSTSPTTGGKPVIGFDHMEGDIYVIHVYESLPTHTATFNWYYVDFQTGEIRDFFGEVISDEAADTSASSVQGWQTYRNEEYGFEFKYPIDWAAIESTSPQYPYLVFITLGPKETIQQGGFFGVTLRDQSKDEFFSLLAQEKFYIISQSETTLGNKQATFYTLGRTDSPGIEWKEVITQKDGFLLEFSRGATSGYDDIFNQMLSTFCFLE
jgi:hypothetical protein